MALNKRQAARNERAVNELAQQDGNKRCADCGELRTGWASWNLGIFLCMRCGALHRKLGVHISKVKSLHMDSWSPEQVDNMRKIGNDASNRKYNPKNIKPSIPIDVDEIDGAMERFIRQKYEYKSFTTEGSMGTVGQRQHTGSTSTNSDEPPPLPPKPSKRFHFGLRSATAPITRTFSSEKSPPSSPRDAGFDREPSSPRANKPSRIFGAKIGSSSSADFDTKLAQLRDMGFSDERRNSDVLKGLNGNLDKAIETLVRMGDGAKGTNKGGSPAVPPKDNPPAGISIPKSRQNQNGITLTPTATAGTSNNPFDNIPPASSVQQPQAVQSGLQGFAPPARSFTSPNSYNPFMQPTQATQPPFAPQQPSLEQSFQGLNLTPQPHQQPQQLFPNATGGFGNPPQHQNNPYLQTFTPPPLPSHAPSFPSPGPQQQSDASQFFQPPQPPFAHNPFLRQSKSQTFTPSSNSNPFGLTPNQMQSPSQVQQPGQQLHQSHTFPLGQQPFQQQAVQQPQQPFQQQSFQQPPQQQQPFQQQPVQQQPQQPQQLQHFQQQQQVQQPSFSTASPSNPFNQQPGLQQNFAPQQQYQQQPQQPQQPVRHDKNSILALYNIAQPNPLLGSAPTSATAGQAPDPNFNMPKRSVTMPVNLPSANAAGPSPPVPAAGSHNPFVAMMAPQQQHQASRLAPVAEHGEALAHLNGAGYATGPAAANSAAFGGVGAPAAGAMRNIGAGSRESVDFMGQQMMNGRHSPDAFAGLSARYG